MLILSIQLFTKIKTFEHHSFNPLPKLNTFRHISHFLFNPLPTASLIEEMISMIDMHCVFFNMGESFPLFNGNCFGVFFPKRKGKHKVGYAEPPSLNLATNQKP